MHATTLFMLPCARVCLCVLVWLCVCVCGYTLTPPLFPCLSLCVCVCWCVLPTHSGSPSLRTGSLCAGWSRCQPMMSGCAPAASRHSRSAMRASAGCQQVPHPGRAGSDSVTVHKCQPGRAAVSEAVAPGQRQLRSCARRPVDGFLGMFRPASARQVSTLIKLAGVRAGGHVEGSA